MLTGNKKRYVLGINCAHDASACLMADGKVLRAILEERLTRNKHQSGFPFEAIKYCFKSTGLSNIREIDCVVVNRHPKRNPIVHRKSSSCVCPQCHNNVILNPSHHLLHALYVWAASGFEETAVLIADGSGYSYGEYLKHGHGYLGKPPTHCEMEEAESLYHFTKNGIKIIDKRWGEWNEQSANRFVFNSLGHMYSAASQYIFGHWTHSGKVMGLSSYGDKNNFPLNMIKKENGALLIKTDWIYQLKEKGTKKPPWEQEYCIDLAAKVQAELESGLLFLAAELFKKTASRNLCIGGGVALNSVANNKLRNSGLFENVFIAPASGDSGTAIGAAIFGYLKGVSGNRGLSIKNDFMGISYDDGAMLDALKSYQEYIQFQHVIDAVPLASRDLENNKVIGWFDLGSEFGPRALGHRSILCNPRNENMKDHLNSKVKFRENFRPYGACVLEEFANNYFHINVSDPYMLSVVKMKDSAVSKIPSLCHVDQSCRIQTVSASYQGKLRLLMEYFYQKTDIPALLNTSFNVRGEPIVESPRDAIKCFLDCGLDVLYLGHFRVTKLVILNEIVPSRMLRIIPIPSEGIMATRRSFFSKKWIHEYYVKKTSGCELQISAEAFWLLSRLNGKNNLDYTQIEFNKRWDNQTFNSTIEELINFGIIRLAEQS